MKMVLAASLVLLFAASAGVAREVTLDADRDSQLMNAGCGGNSNKGNGGKFYYNVGGIGTESGDTVLLSWDLGGIGWVPGEHVASGTLTLYCAGGASNYDWNVKCYPMKKTWVEGIGVPPDGFGGSGYPWGPCSVGDSCQNYQVVQTNDFPRGDNWVALATSGIAWHAPAAKGDDDCDKTKAMVDNTLAGALISNMGAPLGTLPLTAAGCDVVEDWITSAMVNNGLVMILTNFRDAGSVMHLGTRETGCAGPPQTPGVCAAELTLEIVPEPATMALLGIGLVGLVLRRRR